LIFETYFQQRIELAERADRGELSPTASNALAESHLNQATSWMEERQSQTDVLPGSRGSSEQRPERVAPDRASN